MQYLLYSVMNDPIREIQASTTASPPLFPAPWADCWGEDAYGLWQTLAFKDVEQTFRWIPPGRFWMGSSRDEPERSRTEGYHLVSLTKGFWLADTVVTQALWKGVMGEDPSQFTGEDRPVDSVSWENAQVFIEQLNAGVKGLAARLPWEAEWEYACRAGTRTPFSFGEQITPAHVNYNGNYPFRGGKKGLYRQATVAVKSLPMNPWGLYEMHDNVWEWCEDYWQKHLGEGEVTDPTGPDDGSGRVLRGGSWNGIGGFVRSAFRNRDAPVNRSHNGGFRLALDH